MRTRRVFLHTLELIAVALAFLEGNAIARFLVAKVGMDTVVEVTHRFGRSAGRSVSTFLAAIVAEPRLIAVIVAGFFIVLHLLAWGVRSARLHRMHRNPGGLR